MITKESRQNMSLSRKKLFANGYIHPMKGKHLSEETKRKLSVAQSGKFDGKNNPFFGKQHTKQTKKTLSLKNRKHHIFKDGLEYKECYKCKEIKLLSEFHKCKSNWDEIDYKCKNCQNNYYQENKNHILKKRKIQQNKTKEKRKIYIKIYVKNRRKNDIQFNLSSKIRNSILISLKNNYKKCSKYSHTEELLGCNWFELRQYIESLFVDGMIWQDYLNGDIEIHHLQPCYTFDLSDPEQQKECFHFSNLYPLWKEEHRQNYILLHN